MNTPYHTKMNFQTFKITPLKEIKHLITPYELAKFTNLKTLYPPFQKEEVLINIFDKEDATVETYVKIHTSVFKKYAEIALFVHLELAGGHLEEYRVVLD